ncbi:MAG: type III pantothenate kinase [Bacilli bacterium]
MKNKTYLFLDIGNTACDFIITDFSSIRKTQKISVSDKKELLEYLTETIYSYPEIEVYIACVNKEIGEFIKQKLLSSKITNYFLSAKEMKDFVIKENYQINNIDYLGADLFCDLVSFNNLQGLIIIDLGTATKILVLDQENKFLGGQIIPGLFSFPKILSQDTSLLGENPLTENPPLVSLITREAISSGAINGQAAMISKMIEIIKHEYSMEKATILLTGGNSKFIRQQLLSITADTILYDENLVLKGLARAFGFKNFNNL